MRTGPNRNPTSKAEVYGLAALIVIAAAALLSVLFFFAPAPKAAWTKLTGTGADDFAYSVSADPKGDVYVAGSTAGGLDDNAGAGYRDLVLVKYGADGNKLWSRQAGTSSWDEAYATAADGKGNVYAAGYTYGGLGGNPSAGQYDIVIVKYDAAGNKLWVRQDGTPENDYAYAAAVDAKGDVYVVGYTYGRFDGLESDGSADVFLAKYDTEGNNLWIRQTGSPSDDIAYAVAVDGKGDAYLAGCAGGKLDGNTYAGAGDAFLIKYDSGGKKLWSRQLGTQLWDEAWGVAVDNEGNAYITGYTGGRLDKPSGGGAFDVFLAKYDANGSNLWIRQMGSVENDYAYAVAVDGKGNAYITGYTDGGLDRLQNSGGSDIFLAGYSAKGKKLWVRQMGAASDDYAFGVALDAAGNVYLTGETAGGLDGNVNKGAYDLFVMRLDAADNSFMGRIKEALRRIGIG